MIRGFRVILCKVILAIKLSLKHIPETGRCPKV